MQKRDEPGMAYEVYLVNVSRKTVQVHFPIWLCVLAGALKAQNITVHAVDLVPVDFDKRDEYFFNAVPAEPAIIGFNAMAGNDHINQVERLAKIVRQINPEHIIIYGGAMPSSMPEIMIEKCKCDYLLAGEGEVSLAAFINTIREGNFYPRDIPGLYYKKNGEILGKKPEHLLGKKVNNIYQLTELSRPDHSVLEMDFYINYLNETNQSFELMASRGCKGNCSFCHRLVRGLGYKPPEMVLDEIEEVINEYGMDRFFFVDENFFEQKDVFRRFIEEKRRRGLEFTFRAQGRFDAIDDDICKLGRDNGLAVLSMGIESANQNTLNRIGKGIKLTDVEKTIGLIRKHGLGLSPNFIFGFPQDTEQDYIEMINFIRRNGLEHTGKLFYLTPGPGTRLWDQCVRAGKIKDEWEFARNLGDLYYERMINLTNLPEDVLDYYYKKITDIIQRPVTYPKSRKYLELLTAIH